MSVEEIKKALEGVTPGPWEVYSEKVSDKAAAIAESAYQVEHTDPFVGEIFMLNAGGKCPALTGCGPCSEANARYIAAVNPEAISELLSTLEILQRENEEQERVIAGLNKQLTEQFDLSTKYVAKATAAEAEVKRLRALLEKIAPPEQSKSWLPISDWVECRTALASTGGEHNGN